MTELPRDYQIPSFEGDPAHETPESPERQPFDPPYINPVGEPTPDKQDVPELPEIGIPESVGRLSECVVNLRVGTLTGNNYDLAA